MLALVLALFMGMAPRPAIVTDSAGLKMFNRIAIERKSAAQYKMAPQEILEVVPCGQEIIVYGIEEGFNETLWGFVGWHWQKWITDEIGEPEGPIEGYTEGWVLLRFRNRWFVHFPEEREEEREEEPINFNFLLPINLAYGQSLEVFEEIDATAETDFTWWGIAFVGILLGEMFAMCIPFVKLPRKGMCLMLLWLLTAVGFGYGRLTDIALILKGGLGGG